MENNIGVGAIIGLALTTSIYVWNNEKFSGVQKTILLICIVFPPAQWLGILVVLAYNNYKLNNSIEKVQERKVEQVKVNLDNSISSLKDLKDKGILTAEEYKTKVAKINAEKDEQSLKNSLEYRQLKSLSDNGILTKEEFESKVKLIEKTATIESTNIESFSPSFQDYWSKNKGQILSIGKSMGIILLILLVLSIIASVV
jgi:hypothetical protein